MLLTKGMIYAPAAEHEEYLGSFHIGSNDYFDLDKV